MNGKKGWKPSQTGPDFGGQKFDVDWGRGKWIIGLTFVSSKWRSLISLGSHQMEMTNFPSNW